MIDFDANNQIAQATAALMRTCAVATAQTMSASACQSLTLWSDILRARYAPPDVSAWTRPCRDDGPFTKFWPLLPMGWMTTPHSNTWAWAPMSWTNLGHPSLGRDGYGPAWLGSIYPASWAAAWGSTCWQAMSAPQPATSSPLAASTAAAKKVLRYASDTAFASYRSSGGHAVARVIVPAAAPVIAQLSATTAFTPMQSIFGAWRAALHV